ncbi:MAG: M13 family metallopeptidase [Archangium sp.]|nr:M13 family metallopeptidase [Archangium sp.]MDP3573081.1 M13 family metallopeptidase [Archangium sp.]
MKTPHLAALLLASCATQQPVTRPAEPAPAPVVAPVEPKKWVADLTRPMPAGLDDFAMDFTADPCTDFYQYACGGWMAKTEIPGDRPLYSRGFVSISDRNEEALKGILEEAAAGKLPPGTPFAKQLGDAYATCIDEAALEKTGLSEVKKFIAQATAIKNPSELAKSIALLHAAGFRPFFAISSEQDHKNSTEVIAGLTQAGLGLPDREYYVAENQKMADIRAAYLAYVEKMLTLAGEKPEAAKASAAAVMALETRLAKASLTRVERRDPDKIYNRVDRKGLEEKAAGFPWAVYFASVGQKDLQAINISSVPFFAELGAIANDTKPEVLKPYLTWVVLRGSVTMLPKVFQEEAFAYNARNFSGAKEDRPRWKKCVTFVDGAMGEALGREFTRRLFPEDSKARTTAMVTALLGSFEKNLGTLGWMDETTQQAALVKARSMVGHNKIGFPDNWRDYGALKTDRKSFFANALAARRFESTRELTKIGKPVDRGEWWMSPPTVNAYYEGQLNEIVFPAGILQPPFFNKAATDAVNFGSMGMVVGHEITHGFDDHGRRYDADGNLKDWWSEASGKNFVSRVACVKNQFDGYTAVDDLKVKGDLTLGENVADLGGLKLAHAAMVDWYLKQGAAKEASRFTESQQFFLGFAQSWCTKVRPEEARQRVTTDTHSPPYWRVNGPLSNSDAFKTAFQCSEKSKMVRAGSERCSVW